MGLEAGSYLDNLVVSNPVGSTDPKSEGDNHLRLIKSTLKNTFPGMVGRSWRSQTKGSTYQIVANDNMSIIVASAAITLTFVAAATLGNGFLVYVDASNGDVTLDPNASEQINGDLTLVVPSGWTALVFCSGSEFSAALAPRPTGTSSAAVLSAMRSALGTETVQWLCFAAADQLLTLTAGTNKFVLNGFPACEVQEVRASLVTASSSGTPTFDINENDVSILSTKITIDANELSSVTAAIPPVISDSTIAEGAKLSIDIDVAGTGAKGWAVMMKVKWL